MQEVIQILIEWLVEFATDLLIPAMIVLFIVSIVFRIIIFFNISRGDWFAREFAKRIDSFVEINHRKHNISFFLAAKKLMEKTFYELFIVRSIMMRRKPDYVASLMDRLFLIQHGTAKLVKDSLKQFRNLKYNENHQPNFTEISIHLLEGNPSYNKIFGVIPASFVNDVLNILPGIFIIGGIFGTFLGIMKALPELGGMDFSDLDDSKAVLDGFLIKVSFSMSTSIIGIILSVINTVLNTIISPQKIFISTVNKLNNSFVILWNISNCNDLPEDVKDFDENRDPMEALAEQSVDKEIARWEAEGHRNKTAS